jgi:hypothetical protein
MDTVGLDSHSADSVIRENIAFLKRFKSGGYVETDADLRKVNELAGVGLMKKGLSLKEDKVAAKVTNLGLELIS